MPVNVSLPDLEATDALARKVAMSLTKGLIIYLNGELGSGKTTFVRSLLKSLGYTGSTKSPTYSLVETYNLQGFTIHHFDLYRLSDPEELEFVGIRDYVNGQAICIFEWPERARNHVPESDLTILFEDTLGARSATVEAHSPGGSKVLQALEIDQE